MSERLLMRAAQGDEEAFRELTDPTGKTKETEMASIRKEIQISAHPDAVWDAIRGFGALHTRFVHGFVVDTRLGGESRIVTFANGAVQREPLVDSDDRLRRLVYSAVDSPIGATHSTLPYRSSPRAKQKVGSSGSSMSFRTGCATSSTRPRTEAQRL